MRKRAVIVAANTSWKIQRHDSARSNSVVAVPSAAEFRLAATRFDDVAGEIEATGRGAVNAGATESLDGDTQAARTVAIAVDALDRHAAEAGATCARLADECRRRADACDAHDAALAAYRAADARWWTQRQRWLEARDDGLPDNVVWSLHPGSRPVEPTPPPFYADAAGACR